MKPDGLSQVGERTVLHVTSDDIEHGGFFDGFRRPASVGRIALIHGIPPNHANEIYEGNTELLHDTYVVPREDEPGRYDLKNGTTVTIINSPGYDWVPGSSTMLYEFILSPPKHFNDSPA